VLDSDVPHRCSIGEGVSHRKRMRRQLATGERSTFALA
jgi:hypothetical protein